ncbi:hypothetical protein M2145_002878 [Lachnospiraceae bacterium PF1-21]|uniref:hypothetical protein n=1 Tax=Ohessyouella blattaphilus TaxID=2949333 RepID=UPI003E2CDC38
MSFLEIKKIYTEERQKQKNELIDWLRNEGYVILTMEGDEASKPHSTGSGKSMYTADSGIKAYDLSNWKWITARQGNKELLLSLQAFDIDPKTKDRHVLMDRIGIYFYKSGKYNPEECVKEMINTGIDLPMNSEKYVLLKEIIDNK